MLIILTLIYMNMQSEQSMNQLEETERIDVSGDVQEDDESFGDLEENASLEDEPGQRIVIDEDTMESNDLLVPPENPPLPVPSQEQAGPLPPAPLPSAPLPAHPEELPPFYKGLISKLEQYGYNEQQLQPSYHSFEEEQRKYLEKIKILYSRFLLGDKPLLDRQFNRLRTLLYVPKYGENLVQWGNRKYGHSLTLPLALERIDHLQSLSQPPPKPRCIDQLRLLLMLAVLLLLIKLFS